MWWLGPNFPAFLENFCGNGKITFFAVPTLQPLTLAPLLR